MVLLNSIADYLLDARVGDIIVLKNSSTLEEFFSPEFKMSTFKVVDIFHEGITVRRYRSHMRVILELDQPILRLSKNEFKALK